MSLLEKHLRLVIDGYDLAAERERYQFDDVTVGGVSLNRGRATIEIAGDPNAPRLDQERRAHEAAILPTTTVPDSPVLELGWPQAGHYVRCEAGTYFDAYLAVAQKLFDEHHPSYRKMLQQLAANDLLLRREINTDDFLAARRGAEGIVTPQMLAALVAKEAARAFPIATSAPGAGASPWRVFFSNSGTEAIEAALKLACRVAHGQLLETFGPAVEAELMRQLGIPRTTFFEAREPAPAKDGSPLYADYPFFFFACEMAFHGRTLGALNLNLSKAVHKRGYPTWRRVRHVPFNGSVADLEAAVDPRPLDQILAADGGVAKVLADGRVPKDLAAAFVVEAFQGEGGYRLADGTWLREIGKLCRRHDILLVADEIQSFARTGRAFLFEHFGVAPDVVAVAKAAIVGMTIARAEYARHLPPGWHSNTWGGGKVFDNHFAYTTIDTYLHRRDPLFLGRTLVENQRTKGEYVRAQFALLLERHPDLVTAFSGLGGMWGVTVRRREEIVPLAWKRGLKLLGCGPSGPEARLRILFLADVLTREIDHFFDTFDAVLAELSG
jgi:4-aminobutyrate aminotransferase-like enzyme